MSSDGVAGWLRWVAIDDREGRLRTGWRFVVAAVAVLVASVAATVGVGLLTVLVDAVGLAFEGVVAAAVVLVAWLLFYGALTAALVVVARYVDRRTMRDLGLAGDHLWANLAVGVGIGVAMIAAVAAVEVALGLATIEGTLVSRTGLGLGGLAGPLGESIGPGIPVGVALAVGALFHVGVAVFEEVLFRGYLLVNTAEGSRGLVPGGRRGAVLTAVVLTSVAFAAGHLSNPGARLLGGVNIFVIGVFLAGAFVATGDLGVPIGIHFGWNAGLGTLFGFPVSGLGSPASVVDLRATGDPLLTGGSFGPEAGLVFYVGLAVGVALTWLWIDRLPDGLVVRSDLATPELR